MHDERDVLQPQFPGETVQMVGMRFDPVIKVPGFIRETEPDLVDGNDPVISAQIFDQFPEFKDPERAGMEQQDHRSAAFIHIVEFVGTHGKKVTLERKDLPQVYCFCAADRA